MSTLPLVTITTDGAARGNPGPGGWAALLQADGRERLITGEEPDHTTNNAMELRAVLEGLRALKRPCHVVLRADSTYVLEGLQKLLAGAPLPQRNRQLWDELRTAARGHTLTLEWVRGHSGDTANERVNTAANEAANRAYAAAYGSSAPADASWTLALCSPSGDRPARWGVITPHTRASGDVTAAGVSHSTALYRALIAGLEAARQAPAASSAVLTVVSNYELIVKQGRGEWRVKHAEQAPLAAHARQLQQGFAEVRFAFAPTEQVSQLIEQAAGT